MTPLTAFHAGVQAALPAPVWAVLRPLIEVYPEPLSLTSWAAYGANPGLHARLHESHLICYPGAGFVRAADVLFPEGLS